MKQVLDMVKGIDQALRYPEGSPLGRDLVGRAERNEAAIRKLQERDVSHDTEIDKFNAMVDQRDGVIRFLRFASLLIGIILALFALKEVAGI